MYRLLLAEDENVFRNALLAMIEWSDLGILPPSTAKNGEEALHCILEQQPDILITDIRMPQMSGLELVKWIQEKGLNTICIILTGHNDFNYAQQAIRFGAFDFVLKPCKPNEISDAVRKAKTVLDEKKFKREAANKSMRNWNANKGIVKEQLLTQWIRSSERSLEKREKTIRELALPIPSENLHVGILRFLLQQTNAKDYEEKDMDLIRFAAMNIVQETLSPLYRGKLDVFRHQNEIVWIGDGAELTVNGGEAVLETLFDNMHSYLQMPVTLAVGPIVPHLNGLHESYHTANDMLEKSYFWGEKGLFMWNETPQQESRSNQDDPDGLVEAEKNLMKHLLGAQYAEALDNLDEWLELLCCNRDRNKTEIHLRALALLIELQKVATGRQGISIKWKESTVFWVNQLPNVETFWELSIIVKKMIHSWVEAHTFRDRIHRTVQAVIKIIQARYYDNLSLEAVAKETFVSSTYLSGLFKQEIGMNFLDYLHHYRVEQSKSLLLDPDVKIYSIAKEVGYRSERHFSETFKKWVGLSPSQYQKHFLSSR
jgi:two-component system response regulator YesN